MKTNKIMSSVAKTMSRTGLRIKKHSPEILVVSGVTGMVVSAVMACKATTKVNDILEEAKVRVEKIREVAAMDAASPEPEYTEQDMKKAIAVAHTQTGMKLVRLYGPSIALGTLSIASILTSNNIMRKRNMGLAAAYAAVNTGFKEYRGRVVERFGEALDRELKYDLKAVEVENTVVDENGKEKVVKESIEIASPSLYSPYARFYDDGCKGWTKDPETNLVFLRHTQNYANDLLKARGHVFLNEVFDMLGIPRCKAGQVVGWVYDEKNPIGDNYIDFGIYDMYKEGCRDFVNGYERTVILDFNVDGDIMSLI